jgi:hypothetical protein
MRGRRRLADRFALPTGELRTHVLNHQCHSSDCKHVISIEQQIKVAARARIAPTRSEEHVLRKAANNAGSAPEI